MSLFLDRIKRRVPARLISRLTPQQRADLKLMKIDNGKAPRPFQPSNVLWAQLSKSFEQRLHMDGIEDAENSYVNSWFFGQPPGHKKYYHYALWLLYLRLRERDRHGLLDRVKPSGNSKKGVVVEILGHSLSWDYLISIDTAISMAEIEPRLLTEAMIVAELGAGWGRLGYVLKKINPRLTYIDCDIPVSLIVAQSYLPKTLPDEIVYSYATNRGISDATNRGISEFSRSYFLSRQGLHFCGTQQLVRFTDRAVDFFININSFGEMSREQVTKYLSIGSRIADRALYILQRDAGDVIRRGEYPIPDGWPILFDRPVSFAPEFFEMACLRS
jgi:putative sugar O-methyltransferase